MCEILQQLKKKTQPSLKESSSRMECVISEEIAIQCQHAGGSGLYAQHHRKLGVVSQTCNSSKGWRQEV